jgi:hypothetical protein
MDYHFKVKYPRFKGSIILVTGNIISANHWARYLFDKKYDDKETEKSTLTSSQLTTMHIQRAGKV